MTASIPEAQLRATVRPGRGGRRAGAIPAVFAGHAPTDAADDDLVDLGWVEGGTGEQLPGDERAKVPRVLVAETDACARPWASSPARTMSGPSAFWTWIMRFRCGR